MEGKHWFRMESDRLPPLQRAWYGPALKSEGANMAAMGEAEYVSRKYFQLKSRYTVRGIYLYHIGRAETDQY